MDLLWLRWEYKKSKLYKLMSTESSSKPTGIKIIKKSYKQNGASSSSSLTSSASSSLSAPSDTIDTSLTLTLAEDTTGNTTADDPRSPDDSDSTDKVMSLTAAQKGDLIEKMETRKHKLKLAYREARDPEIKRQFAEVCELLAKVKECDAIDKMQTNITDNTQLTQEFRRKVKQLAVTDFNRIIDLTGSKDGRKPDVTTETWLKGRTVVFKDKVYRPPPEDKLEKFKQKMCLKPMPSDLKKKIDTTVQGNLETAAVRSKPEALKYKTYNPLEFSGLTPY